jgi:hypothetical protein
MKHIVIVTRILQYQFEIEAADEHDAYRVAKERAAAGFPGMQFADISQFHTIKMLQCTGTPTVTHTVGETRPPAPKRAARK